MPKLLFGYLNAAESWTRMNHDGKRTPLKNSGVIGQECMLCIQFFISLHEIDSQRFLRSPYSPQHRGFYFLNRYYDSRN